MDDAPTDRSFALGFWIKHQSAMEAFESMDDEDNSVPLELRDVFESERFKPLLDQIYDSSVSDGNTLVIAIADAVTQEWSKAGGLVIKRVRPPNDWEGKLLVRRKRPRGGDPVQVGFIIQSIEGRDLTFYCYLWSKGGKRAAEFNTTSIRSDVANFLNERTADGSYWDNAVTLLARVPLKEFLSGDEFESRKCLEHATSKILRCRENALLEILNQLR